VPRKVAYLTTIKTGFTKRKFSPVWQQELRSELPRQVDKITCGKIKAAGTYLAGNTRAWAVLKRAVHERGPHSDASRRLEISYVRRHHHDLLRPNSEEVGSREVQFRVGLVPLRQLGRKNAVPRQLRVFCHVGQQGHIAVGQRSYDVLLLQTRQPLHRVGPGVEPVP
jgi:hypothetical protein